MVTKSLRRNLLATTIIAGSLMSAPAFAQTPAATAPAEEDTIVVTGSLISNPNLAQSSPVLVTTSEEIALRQNNVAEEVLRDIPGVVPSIGSAVNNGNGGASYVDLRGLGSNRNVVLLDGNRIAPSGLVGRVDLNNIPLALIDRVDALTGGASTTYGADAISGVVNFITKRDFSGVEISAGEKITEKGDGNYLRTDVTIGGNFDEGKGNAVLSIGYQESDPVYQGDRDFSINNISSFSGTFGGSGTTVPSRVTGTRPLTAAGVPDTTISTVNSGNGGTRQINFGRAGVAGGGVDGSATAGNYAPFNFNPYNIFQTPFIRYNAYAAARYEVSDNIEVYTRALFSKNNVKTIIAPSGSFGSSVTVNLNNPYLPSTLRSQFCAFNTLGAGAYQPLYTTTQCAAAATATGPSDPNYRTVTFNLSRRFVEDGPRISDFSTTIFDYRAGVKGAINDHINWDVSGSYGESENRQTLQGYVLTSRVRQALLANNTTTCITATNGCVPINVFGPAGSISQAAAAYVQQASTTLVKTTLAQARAVINGDFGLTIPSAADAVQFAVGAEYRKYGASQAADSLAKQAGELGGAGGAAPDINGGYDVYEAFGELVVPLVQDKPFFDELTIKGGARYSSYKVNAAGNPKYNTTTYKGELSWSPVRDLKFRAGYSRAVRAPNISELFTPVTTGLTSLSTDPCAGAAPTTNANLRAVCLAQGAPAGTIGSILNPTAGQANNTSGGNLNVKPETSDSYTVGAVIQPSFVPGFTMTVDYYNIKVKQAITSPTPADVIGACFRNITAASATDPACTAVIRRNPVTGGLDGDPSTTLGLITQLTNSGQLKTDGIDLALNYRRDIGFAKLALSFLGNYTFHSNFRSNVADSASVDRDCTGYFSANCSSIQPKFQWSQRTTLSFDKVDVSLLWRHIDQANYEATASNYVARGLNKGTAAAPVPDLLYSGNLPDGTGPYNFNHIRPYDYFDLSTRFALTSTLELTMGVTNVFNVKPPIVGSTAGTTSFNSGNTYPSTYDSLGRAYAASVKVRF
jgi:outer membrane receptor protein involved in Fe transport